MNLTIEGNDIEDDGGAGVAISASHHTVSAISVAIDDNLLKLNAGDGIYVSGGNVTLSIQTNTVENNGGNGIEIDGESNATIGGTVARDGNVIAGNTNDGISINGYAAQDDVVVAPDSNWNTSVLSAGDLIENNLIGVVERELYVRARRDRHDRERTRRDRGSLLGLP